MFGMLENCKEASMAGELGRERVGGAGVREVMVSLVELWSRR